MAFAVADLHGAVYGDREPRVLDGVLSPDGLRALVSIGSMLYEIGFAADRGRQGSWMDTLEVEQAQGSTFGGAAFAAKRWGTALSPWVSWSHDGRRAVFAQGGILYLGDVPQKGWITWQRVEVPLRITPAMPRGTIAIRGARLITMRGHEVIERGDLVVKDNRVAAVGPSGQVVIPPDAWIVDANGTTILPGYVDIHEHSGRPHGIHPTQSWRSLLELAYGVTTVRDPYSQGDNDDFAYADRERAGDFLGPRLFSTGVAYVGPYLPVCTLDDGREAVRRHAEDFRTETFKIYYDSENTDRRARQLLASATREAGLNATVHINGLDHALAGMIDGLTGIEHQPNIKIYDDVASLVAQSGVTYTNTYLGALFGSMAFITRRHGVPLNYPKVRRFVPPSAREATCTGCTGDVAMGYAPLELDNVLALVSGPARIVARGGRVGMGSHGNVVGIGFHYEMWLHALGRMSNHEILRSATIVGATAIGHGNDFGSIGPGKLADLQILDKNPLQDIHHTTSIRYVMKNGRLYQAEDLTEIWPRRKPLESKYFWEDSFSRTDPAGNEGGPTRRRKDAFLPQGDPFRLQEEPDAFGGRWPE
jgi:imidazolonepropionase-like amidohydrolase